MEKNMTENAKAAASNCCYSQESLDFMERILSTSNIGESTYWPPGILRCLQIDEQTGLNKRKVTKKSKFKFF